MLREPPGRLRAVRAPNAGHGVSPRGPQQCELFDAVRYLRLRAAPGTGRAGHVCCLGNASSWNTPNPATSMFVVPLSDGDVEKTARSGGANSAGRTRPSGNRWTWGDGTAACSAGVPGWGFWRSRSAGLWTATWLIRAMREDGLGIRAIGREMDSERRPRSAGWCRRSLPVLHNPITSLGRFVLLKWCLESGQLEGYEIRNGCAAKKHRRKSGIIKPDIQPEHANIT